MNNSISKTPFLFLLIALIIGVILQYYLKTDLHWSIIATFLGGVIMLLSLRNKIAKQYQYRWIFGIGTSVAFIGVGGFATYAKQDIMCYQPNENIKSYIGYVIDAPQEKQQSTAYKLHLEDEDVSIICYFQRDSLRNMPQLGDVIVFIGQLQKIKNLSNPDEFDYSKYMYDQGFVASCYLPNKSWILTGEQKRTIKIEALKIRDQIINIYNALGFTDEEQSILAALTLGYQDSLSEDIKQSFRATGTVHILSVSGLHVGIIYGIIVILLSFISKRSKYSWIKSVLIILLLWSYAFVTGLPPSVVRAGIMLTIVCVGDILNKKASPLNNLYLAAFAMLLYNPFQLFDIGFQLSCLSVFSILLFYPLVIEKFKFKNPIIRYLIQLLVVSFAAQIATFPLCLFYFGTFPTYFFLANLLIVPIVSLITYSLVALLIYWKVVSLFEYNLFDFIVTMLQYLVGLMIIGIRFFENLPFALFDEIKISFTELLLIYLSLITLYIAVVRTNSKALLFSLIAIILLLVYNILDEQNTRKNALIVYNRNRVTDIRFLTQGEHIQLNDIIDNYTNPCLSIGGKSILIMNKIVEQKAAKSTQYYVDYIVLIGSSNYQLSEIEKCYNIENIVLDGSLKGDVRRRLTKECENRGLTIHDVTQKGALSINF